MEHVRCEVASESAPERAVGHTGDAVGDGAPGREGRHWAVGKGVGMVDQRDASDGWVGHPEWWCCRIAGAPEKYSCHDDEGHAEREELSYYFHGSFP